jgi:5-methyltetrahydropteroyltriglutamate--homocysteine methyltransferase
LTAVKRGTERILTTHVGSLPRPRDLWAMIEAKDRSQPYDQNALAKRLKSAVADIVRKQDEAGNDIPSDGEQSKPSFTNYVRDRLPAWMGSTRALPQRAAHVSRVRGLAGQPPSQSRRPAGGAVGRLATRWLKN